MENNEGIEVSDMRENQGYIHWIFTQRGSQCDDTSPDESTFQRRDSLNLHLQIFKQGRGKRHAASIIKKRLNRRENNELIKRIQESSRTEKSEK